MLFDSSEEAPGVQGLGVFKGKNVRFRQGKIPQIGWNQIRTEKSNTLLSNDYFYFVNSFHVVPADPAVVSATAEYHIPFTAAVEKGNIVATQFHPEKSGKTGQEVLRRWVESFKIEAEK